MSFTVPIEIPPDETRTSGYTWDAPHERSSSNYTDTANTTHSHLQYLVSLFDASARSSYQLPCIRHEDLALRGDSRLIHDHFKSVVQASTQDQVARLDAPSYQLASGSAPQVNGGPDYDHSRFLMRANSQDHVTQLNAPNYQSLIGSATEASTSQYSTLANALTLSVTPTQPQYQPDARSNEPPPSNPVQCPNCGVIFGRMQERDRHLESYLPHSILCSFQGCTWTGRRQWDFKKHWRRKHPEAGQVPGGDANEIYDPKDFVKSIVDGTSVDEVARSAFAKVQESLERLGKPDVGAKVLGRSKDLGKWIRPAIVKTGIANFD